MPFNYTLFAYDTAVYSSYFDAIANGADFHIIDMSRCDALQLEDFHKPFNTLGIAITSAVNALNISKVITPSFYVCDDDNVLFAMNKKGVFEAIEIQERTYTYTVNVTVRGGNLDTNRNAVLSHINTQLDHALKISLTSHLLDIVEHNSHIDTEVYYEN